MNTLEVICIEFTRQSPSRIPLSARAASTWGVMFTKSMRFGTWSASLLRKLLIWLGRSSPGARQAPLSIPRLRPTPKRWYNRGLALLPGVERFDPDAGTDRPRLRHGHAGGRPRVPGPPRATRLALDGVLALGHRGRGRRAVRRGGLVHPRARVPLDALPRLPARRRAGPGARQRAPLG